MKSRSTKIWFSPRFAFFAFFEQERVDQKNFGQNPDDRIEKLYVSIFVDIHTVSFILGV